MRVFGHAHELSGVVVIYVSYQKNRGFTIDTDAMFGIIPNELSLFRPEKLSNSARNDCAHEANCATGFC